MAKGETYVMIVEPDVNIANTRAHWLATHGYQAVLVRSVEGVIEKLSYLRPQLVLSEETIPSPRHRLKYLGSFN